MKLLVFLAVWRRPVITEICFMGLNRLRRVPGFDINVLAVISEESMIPLCEKYNVDWCIAKNSPLGAKKNYGLTQAMRKDFDYLVEIGSDDLLKNDFLELYTWDRPVFGLMDFALVNTENGKCKKLKTNIPKYGAGRAMRKDIIMTDLWPHAANRGMDNYSTFRFAKNGVLHVGVRSEIPVLVGLKSDENLHKFSLMPGHTYDLEKALNGLSEEEINAIQSLIHAGAQV